MSKIEGFSKISPFQKAEFTIDLDKDGIKDYVFLSLGKVYLSSSSFKMERIPKFPPKFTLQKKDELWILTRRKALSWKEGRIILRDFSIKEQMWTRIFLIGNIRANLLTFSLLLTLLLNLLSVERIYNFFKNIFLGKNLSKEIILQNLLHIFSIFSFLTIGIFMGKIVYVLWIWIVPAFSFLGLKHLFRKKSLETVKGIIILLAFCLLQYLFYFGFWIPKIGN